MNPVAVLSDKFIKGISSINQEAVGLPTVDLDEALKTPWDTDAHFVCYRPVDWKPGRSFARCKKSVLSQLRKTGQDLVSNLFVLDYDNPDHARWKSIDQFQSFLESLADAAAKWPEISKVYRLYSTRNGARLIYLVKDPLPVDLHENFHRGLVSNFNKFGISIDKKCSDWTRCFRLPYVYRDLTHTSKDGEKNDYIPVQLYNQPIQFLDLGNVPCISGQDVQEYGDIVEITDRMPNLDEARRLVFVGGALEKRTDWLKQIEKRLKGRACYDALFSGVIPQPGSRNSKLTEYVGQAIGVAFSHEIAGTTPQHIFGLFLSMVEQFEPDGETRDWFVVLWGIVTRIYSQQAAKEEYKAVKESHDKAQQEMGLESMIMGMRQWCNVPILHERGNNNKQAIEWASERFIVSTGSEYYILGHNGYYLPLPLNAMQLVPQIRRLRLDQIYSVDEQGPEGTRERNIKDILSDHMIAVSGVEMVANGSQKGGVLERMDSYKPILRLPSFRRRSDLAPEFSPAVDLWLQHLCDDHYPIIKRWIGNALAFEDGPICALSIRAEAGAGKKMLVQGLLECMENPVAASPYDLVGNYQYGLINSPFLVVNEGFPTNLNGSATPYHTFRNLVSGEPIVANRRWAHPMTIRCPFRVIFTANNDNIVEQLVGHGNLSEEDRNSLAIRILHLNLGKKGTEFLQSYGGISYTGRKGGRWIAGDGGEESNYVVAKHFLHLYENRSGARGTRFLVEGSIEQNAEILQKLRTQSGSTPLVIETLVMMLNSVLEPKELVITENNRLYVTTHGVTQYFRTHLQNHVKGEALTDKKVLSALRGLAMIGEENKNPILLEAREDLGRRRWIELDVRVLWNACDSIGHDCKKLKNLVDALEDKDAKEKNKVSFKEGS